MLPLFETGDFTLHSGGKSTFRINCEALDDESLKSIAAWASKRLLPFSAVEGIPRGGLRLAEFMRPYCTPSAPYTLIVDDVLSKGTSMEVQRGDRDNVIGLVIFARNTPPEWVLARFIDGKVFTARRGIWRWY